jgi:hypothetical protein
VWDVHTELSYRRAAMIYKSYKILKFRGHFGGVNMRVNGI